MQTLGEAVAGFSLGHRIHAHPHEFWWLISWQALPLNRRSRTERNELTTMGSDRFILGTADISLGPAELLVAQTLLAPF